MGRVSLERISQREYSRRLGISNEAVSKAIREGKIVKGWDKKQQKIIVQHANVEWGALHMKTNVTKLLQQEPGEPSSVNEQTPNTNGATNNLTLTNTSSFGDARRIKEIIAAQLLSLDLKERKEELVKKDDVYKALFAFGQQIRVALMVIPDRVIDAVLASRNRAEAHQLLTGEIHSALENLTKTDFNFQQRQ